MASESSIQFQMQRPSGSTLESATIVDFKNFSRCMCVEYFAVDPIQIGGAGRIVQTDESFITKR